MTAWIFSEHTWHILDVYVSNVLFVLAIAWLAVYVGEKLLRR